MRLKLLLIALMLACALDARALDLSGYQRPDGAITVHRGGDFVDPYFAIKALWAARWLGDPALAQTLAWIGWMLPHQGKDGRFARYCEREGGWEACAVADADDALLALWVELLHEAAPAGLPPLWAQSARRAEYALERLRGKGNGVYRVSSENDYALLMDNAEIYAALRRTGEIRLRAGDGKAGRRYLERARSLRLAVGRTFRPSGGGMLRWTTLTAEGEARFYPDHVAHLYPWLHGMDTGAFGPMTSWRGWLAHHGESWLSLSVDDYPWGLVALLANRKGSRDEVERWLATAALLSDGDRWNVLEEAILQGLTKSEARWR